MAAPVVGANTVASRTTNGTSLSINVPTYSTGNALYVIYADDADAGSASIGGTGWTTVVNDYTIAASGVPDSGSLFVWKRTASGEPASYTITSTVSERAVAVAFVVAGDGVQVDRLIRLQQRRQRGRPIERNR